TEVHRRIGDTAEASAETAISPRDEEAGPGGDVGLKASMRKAFVFVLQKREAKHRKRGYRKNRDVLVRPEKGGVEGQTDPLQTLEPEPEAAASGDGRIPLDRGRQAEAGRANLLVRITCNRRSDVEVDEPFRVHGHDRHQDR